MASQEIPGPALAMVNYGYMLLFFPMVVVSLLPLANYFLKLEKSWALALVVGTAVMLISFTLGGLNGEQVAVIPEIPPTYIDNLIRVLVSLLSTMGYVVAGYSIAILMLIIPDRIKKRPETKL